MLNDFVNITLWGNIEVVAPGGGVSLLQGKFNMNLVRPNNSNSVRG